MNKYKKLVTGALALGLAVAQFVPSYATEASKKLPQAYPSGGYVQNLEFYGVKTCRTTSSTTAVLCASGEGFLDAVCPSGGTIGQYSLAMDSGIAGTRSVTNSDTLLLTPRVWTSTTPAANTFFPNCFTPARPIRFVNGLLGVQSHSGHQTVYYWHKSDGSNP